MGDILAKLHTPRREKECPHLILSKSSVLSEAKTNSKKLSKLTNENKQLSRSQRSHSREIVVCYQKPGVLVVENIIMG